MTDPRTVAVIGLGLMGGSLARDLASLGVHVLGHDASESVVRAAVDEGVLQATLEAGFVGIEAADLVVVAVPVDAAVKVLGEIAPLLRPGAVVTDVGSTKSAIVAEAERLQIGDRFVGSHPLTGDHRSGWSATRKSLYQGAEVFLCPSPSASTTARMVVRRLWERVGARCSELDPEAHDRRMAWVSHLPQIASTAVAGALLQAGFLPSHLGPGGRDVTRLAGGSPEMWRAITLANAAPISEALAAMRDRLARLEEALRGGDGASVEAFFREGHRWSDHNG